jgi:adenylate kinase family enzyme
VQVPAEEQRRRFAEICARDAWVLDTAYSVWIDIALARAELIVGLDLPRHVSLVRLLRRSVMRARTGVAVCNGNRETWRRLVSRDSIVLWHFRSFAGKQRRFREWEGDPRFVRLTSARAVERWLSGVGR